MTLDQKIVQLFGLHLVALHIDVVVQQDANQAITQFFDPESFGIPKLFPESTMEKKELIFRILKLQLQHKWSNTSVTDLLR